MAQKSALPLLILIVVLIFLMSTDLITLPPEWGNGDESYMGLGITITYADGTTREFKPDDYQPFPLKILDSGKEVMKLTCVLYCTMAFNGTVTYWQVSQGRFVPKIITTGWVDVGTVVDDPLPSDIQGTSWTSGTEKWLFTQDVSASEMDSVLQGAMAPPDDYILKIRIQDFQLDVTFGDGSTDSFIVLQHQILWYFQYSESGIASASLRLTTTPVYASP